MNLEQEQLEKKRQKVDRYKQYKVKREILILEPKSQSSNNTRRGNTSLGLRNRGIKVGSQMIETPSE